MRSGVGAGVGGSWTRGFGGEGTRRGFRWEAVVMGDEDGRKGWMALG